MQKKGMYINQWCTNVNSVQTEKKRKTKGIESNTKNKSKWQASASENIVF